MQAPPSLDRRAFLVKSWLLKQLPPDQIDFLAARCHVQRCAANETIFERGMPGTSMMAVISGRVKISVISPQGRELILNVIKPKEVFGEIALLDAGERTATATAIGASELLVLQRRDFLPLLERNGDIGLRIIELLCNRLRTTSQQVEDFLLFDLPVRLARCLVQLAKTDPDWTASPRPFTVRMSQADVGRMIGASRERVSRQLAEWERQGLVELARGGITLRRFDELVERAEGLEE
jgi:CRP/FNR family transcriptional regulator, cyclic AMP receptor protein